MARSRSRRGFIVSSVVTLIVAGFAMPAGAAGPVQPGGFSATNVPATSRVVAAKSASGRLAQSDPALLARGDAAVVNVMVKLDFDASASYAGDISGLAATSPRVTGRKLTGHSHEEQAYDAYAAGIESKFRSDLSAALPNATAGRGLRTVYGGVAVRLPANEAKQLLHLPNVAAVQVDALEQPQTDSSTAFIGAPTIWNQLGGQATAGKGVIFGDLDTGAWPEHPSFADNPSMGAPPAAPSGNPRACNFGDNPLTPATDPFVCNNKMIGGQPFLATYNAQFGGEVYPDSARDSNGHGTHTASTAAGDIVASAPIFGIERGPISGVAPGAWVIAYKVCGLKGCFGSDSAAAVAQAILDGVDVINFSIGGGSSPYSDASELAFLDAYNAGILVSASAGNSGPGAGTTEHLGPWVITVAASTQSREFQSTLTLSDGAATTSLIGTSLTHGVDTPTPVVLAQDIPGEDEFCLTELPPGAAAGKIVACHRSPGRAQKGFNVAAGGAVGMILYNLPLQETESDNHWLPAIHLADGTNFLAFLAAHPGATATFTTGVKASGQGDVMAAFSSRGPGGAVLKPDIAAPGVQILAGNTPTPDEVAGGPPGEYFQAIAGTSMSAPHISGSALLLASLHPTWSPGAIKSALMTTATENVVKEDLVTPADPFDFGAGRVDLTKAGAAGLVIQDSALDMVTLGQSDLTAPELNIPSINLPTMPGSITVHRTATNVTNARIIVRASAVAPPGATISVSPDNTTIAAGQSRTFTITVRSTAAAGVQYFGEVRLTPRSGPALHLPVAFFNQQGAVTLAQSCTPATIRLGRSTSCNVTATNDAFDEATVSLTSQVSNNLRITSAVGATTHGSRSASAGPATLHPKLDAVPAIAPGSSPGGGYLPLSLFGIPQDAIGDEEAINYTVDPFVFGGRTYTTIGVISDGYIVLGGSGGGADINFVPQTFPDPNRPNGVLAAYWTDLEGTDPGFGVRVAGLTDGVNNWIVVDYNLHLYGLPAQARDFEVWIGVNGVEDISYSYDTDALGQLGTADGLTIGAENQSGTGGAQITGAPTSEYVVTTAPGGPGGSVSYTLDVRGTDTGTGVLSTSMSSNTVLGSTIVRTQIPVRRR